MKPINTILTIALIILSSSALLAQEEPKLKIGEKSYSLSELLKRSDVEDITVKNDSGYAGREMHYRAIRAAKLFEGTRIKDDEVIQFRCSDGFSAFISKERIMSDSAAQSVGYVALEDPHSPWPDLASKEHAGSAGPFYLVWLKPELSGILQEEWPFKLVAFEVKGRIQELYPKIFPSNQTDVRVSRGLKLFQRSCFACHPINGQGAAKIGPDLNLPMNPTEYFKENVLQRYIRDPKSVRTWDSSKMPGFDQAFSDQDIGDVIEYLKVMAKERKMKGER